MIATAAHVVHRAASIVVRPGWSGETPPSLGMAGGRVVVRPGFTSETATPDEDLAIILLEGALDAAASPLPLRVIDVATARQTPAKIVGYPLKGPLNNVIPGDKLFEASGPVTVEGAFRLRYRIPTQGGQSGAPILMTLAGRPCVVGLHLSGRDAIAPDSNRGMLFTDTLVDWINSLNS
jgi:V8-like Glu-specific endopeptidase